ncbi:MAG: hypothetical protein Q9180_008141, partial [Flavoplaca navasiana]
FREHTTTSIANDPQSSSGGPSPGAAVALYSSSASAVCVIWLLFNIYVSNALRAYYFQSLEKKDAFGTPSEEQAKAHDAANRASGPYPESTPEATSLKAAVATTVGLHGKVSSDLAFAKREVAYGKLDASEFSDLVNLL